jgi:predicted nucleic acid-binding protein
MMVLVDTSVWVDHLRNGNEQLVELLEAGRVLTHNMVIGELACGNLRNRQEVLGLLQALPAAQEATMPEVMDFVETVPLSGRGLGWVDVNLLAAARLSDAPLLTLDRSMRREARRLGVGFPAYR